MRLFVASLAATLAFAGAGHAQSGPVFTNPAGSITPQVLRGTSADPATKKQPAAKPAPQTVPKAAPKAVPQQHVASKQNPPQLRATRYGAAPVPAQPAPPRPELDTSSPRSLT